MPHYNPFNWYWTVGDAAANQVYSSAEASFVPDTDATYQAWLAMNNIPTSIDTIADLMAVLSEQNPAATPFGRFIGAGAIVTSTTYPAINGTYAIDAVSQSRITTETNFIDQYGIFTNNEATNMPWPLQNGGDAVFPTTAAFVAFAKQVGLLVAAGLAAPPAGPMPSNAIEV